MKRTWSTWGRWALLAFAAAGCEEPAVAYLKKLSFEDQAADIGRNGDVVFRLDIVNLGDRAVTNVPLQVKCRASPLPSPVTGSVDSGPIAPRQRVAVTAKLAHLAAPPPPIATVFCQYEVRRVELSP